MFTLYLVCLVVGGALVALSIVAGGDGELDLGDLGGGLDISADAAEVGGASFRSRPLSFRNAVFLVAFFGLTGTVLTVLGTHAWLALPFAAGAGLVAAVLVHRTFAALENDEAGAVEDAGSLNGAMAEVIVDIDRARPGKIAVYGGDRRIHLIAGIHADAEARRFRTGDEVLIVDVDGDTARVAGPRFLQ